MALSSERAPLAPIILLRKKSVARSAVLPLRKKSHSAQLFAYKCAHDASLSLPTFCGYWCVFSMFDSYYASLHKPRGRNLKGRGERAYARMRNRRHSKALQDAEPTSAANPSLPLGVSRDTDTKLKIRIAYPRSKTLKLAVNQIESPQSFFDCK